MPRVKILEKFAEPEEVERRKIADAQREIRKAMAEADIRSVAGLAKATGIKTTTLSYCIKHNRWGKEQFKALCSVLSLTDEQKNIIWEVA